MVVPVVLVLDAAILAIGGFCSYLLGYGAGHRAGLLLRSQQLDRVMRNVVCGEWYDDPANDRGGPAVSRLHDAEREMWALYDESGIDPGDSYIRRTESKP